jgi:hypothetical protein
MYISCAVLQTLFMQHQRHCFVLSPRYAHATIVCAFLAPKTLQSSIDSGLKGVCHQTVLPGADHASVVVPALAEQTPVVSNQVQIQVVCRHLGFAVLNLLKRALIEVQWRSACMQQSASTHAPCTFGLYIWPVHLACTFGLHIWPAHLACTLPLGERPHVIRLVASLCIET